VTKLKEENRPLFEYGNLSHGGPPPKKIHNGCNQEQNIFSDLI
jgi:hypothetical protein